MSDHLIKELVLPLDAHLERPLAKRSVLERRGVDASGDEIVLDRPTSFEMVGTTAYVVSLTGEVVRIDGVGAAPFGRR